MPSFGVLMVDQSNRCRKQPPGWGDPAVSGPQKCGRLTPPLPQVKGNTIFESCPDFALGCCHAQNHPFLTAVAVATTVAFAGTGVASAESSDIKLGNLFSSSKSDNLSSKLDEHLLSKEEKQIKKAAEEWAEEHDLEKSEKALENAKEIHKLAVKDEYEEFDGGKLFEIEDGLWAGFDGDKGTFFKVAKKDLDVLLTFLEDRGQTFDDTYGVQVSSDKENYYLTIGIAEKK